MNSTIWKTQARDVIGNLRIGLYDHEKLAPQRVLLQVSVWHRSPAVPQDLSECFDYDRILSKVWADWEQRPQIPLIEPLVFEMHSHIFKLSHTVEAVEVSLYKPDVWQGRAVVGTSLKLTRQEWLDLVY